MMTTGRGGVHLLMTTRIRPTRPCCSRWKRPSSSSSSSSSSTTSNNAAKAVDTASSTTTEARAQIRRLVLTRMAAGLLFSALPVGVWWYYAKKERKEALQNVLDRPMAAVLAAQANPEPWLEQCQAGDVIVFDRRCQRCAASPWAALACLAGRQFLCDADSGNRTVESGHFEHIGLIVPGHVKGQRPLDYNDPNRLLLLEATPSGIVARPLQQRLEASASRSAILLPLCSPGEKRSQSSTDDRPSPAVERVQQHVETELMKFRDKWVQLGQEKGWSKMHSTLSLGGALTYGLGLQDYVQGPISPAAYLVLMGLQQAAAAQNLNEKYNQRVKPEDFLRDYRFDDGDNVVRLRPGWRFLAPVTLRETTSLSSSR